MAVLPQFFKGQTAFVNFLYQYFTYNFFDTFAGINISLMAKARMHIAFLIGKGFM